MPRAVHVLALGIFTMVTSEFLVAGLMPQLADGLSATIPQIGYLVTAFAAAMALGGPIVTATLLKLRPKSALLALFAVFLVGNTLAATATAYPVMLVARIVTGVAAAAFLGVAVSLCARLVGPELRARAMANAMNGLMFGTMLGLPLATFVGDRLGWRAAFWAIAVLTVAAALAVLAVVPADVPTSDADATTGSLRHELRVFARGRLWRALSTSTFVIGATFAAFSYFNPILTQVTGLDIGTVPLLLVGYGVAALAANTVVGRLADHGPGRVVAIGLALNAAFQLTFAQWAHVPAPAVAAMLGIGLVGISLNPAMIARVQAAGNTGPLVNTAHTSALTLGIIIGSSVGGLAIDAFGLRAPLLLGAVLATAGLITLLPELFGARRGRRLREAGDTAPVMECSR